MRIGTWNLDARWSNQRREFLEGLECEVLLLTSGTCRTRTRLQRSPSLRGSGSARRSSRGGDARATSRGVEKTAWPRRRTPSTACLKRRRRSGVRRRRRTPGHDDHVSLVSRLGVKTNGVVVFRCASCGGRAATLAVTDSGTPVDGGPMPDGSRLTWTPDSPAYRLEFVCVNTGPASSDLAQLISGVDLIDPLAVRRVDWELAAFCCRECELNYCSKCWSTWVEFDDGFFDCMRGHCPRGHEQKLDD